MRHAAAALRGGNYLRIDGGPLGSAWADISGSIAARTAAGCSSCNYPHHRAV
jgi:hypothetical protein